MIFFWGIPLALRLIAWLWVGFWSMVRILLEVIVELTYGFYEGCAELAGDVKKGLTKLDNEVGQGIKKGVAKADAWLTKIGI